MTRPGWEEYFMSIARQVATRSTCTRPNRQVGCVITVGKRIVATGYNGPPSGLPHCEDAGCARGDAPSGELHELCRGLHAEQNALVQAATHGTAVAGGDLYCTHKPCVLCTKMLINAGIQKVYYVVDYPDNLAGEMAAEAGLEFCGLSE